MFPWQQIGVSLVSGRYHNIGQHLDFVGRHMFDNSNDVMKVDECTESILCSCIHIPGFP